MRLETTATEISNEIAKLATEMDAILRKQYQTATANRPWGDDELAEQMRVARNNSGTLIQALTLIEKYQAVTAKQEEEEETEEIGISEKVLNWINEETHRDSLEEKSTKDVALKFNLETNAAYRLLNILADKKLITKLEPVNSNKFDCCGWIRNEDIEE